MSLLASSRCLSRSKYFLYKPYNINTFKYNLLLLQTCRWQGLYYLTWCSFLKKNPQGSKYYTISMVSSDTQSTMMCISHHTKNFFCLGKSVLKKLADDQCSFITEGSIYYIKHMHVQLFSMEVDWPEIWCLWKYLLCFIFAHTAFLLWGAEFLIKPWGKLLA